MFSTLLLVACCLSADPTTPANEDMKLEVRRLVKKLDADQLAEREAAEASLLEKGAAALDFLPQVDDKSPPEIRQRVTRVRQKLQQAAAETTAKPTLITLKDNAIPLSKVIAALSEQSGNKIVDGRERMGQPVSDPTIKVNFEKTPFWQALDQTLDQASMMVYPYGEESSVGFLAKDPKLTSVTQVVAYAGPLRVAPTTVEAIRFLRAENTNMLNITLEVAWEPRLKPVGFKQRLEDLVATDDKGNRLKLAAESELETPVHGSSAGTEMVLPFIAPTREVKEIASVKGKLSAIIPGKVETFEFDNLLKAKNAEKRIAGVVVTLESVRKNNDAWEVNVRVKFDEAGEALASHRGWIYQNEAYIEGPDGKPIAYDGFETTRQDKDEVGMAYLFTLEKPPENLKFIYKTPASISTPTFEYELKGIKLP